jgi:hypothetical protein
MLAILVFWTALPGLACLAPAPQHACCQQMMQDCGPSMTMTDPSCCMVHSSDTSMPPAQATRIEASTFATHIYAGAKPPTSEPGVAAFARMAEMPPGAAGSSHNSILRI